MHRMYHKQVGLRTLSSVTSPPLASAYVMVKKISSNKQGVLFPSPAFTLSFENNDPLTKNFFYKFFDLVAIKLLQVNFDKTTHQQMWIPIEGVKISIGFRNYDCDWPLIAVIPYPDNSIILFSNDSSQCSFDELSLLAEEYKSKIPLEIYVKIKASKHVSITSRSNMQIYY